MAGSYPQEQDNYSCQLRSEPRIIPLLASPLPTLQWVKSAARVARATAYCDGPAGEDCCGRSRRTTSRLRTTTCGWGLAHLYVAMGRKGECFDALRKAVESNPANKSQLPRNPTFEPIRSLQ